MRQQRLLSLQHNHRQTRKDQIRIEILRIRIGYDLVFIAVADGVGAPVVTVIIHKTEPHALRIRRGQMNIRPGVLMIHAQRAIKGIALRVIAQHLPVILQRGHQRHGAFLACILQRPDLLDVAHGLHHRRIRRSHGNHAHNRRKQRRHRQQYPKPHDNLRYCTSESTHASIISKRV